VSDEIKTKFGFDVTEFKNNISDMNRGIRIAQNNWKAAAGALGDWKESQEGISTRIKSLNDIMELQRAKVEKLTKEYDDLKGSGTASKDALRKLEEQISKANAELGQTAGDLKSAEKAQDNFGKETKAATGELYKFGKEVDDTGGKTNKLSSFLKSAGSAMKSGIVAGVKAVGASMAAIGGAAVAAGTAVAGFTKKAIDNADAIQKQADMTGLTAEQVQELSYVAATAGVEFDTLAGAQGKLTKSMFAASENQQKQMDSMQASASKVQALVDSHAGYDAILKELSKTTDVSTETQKKLAKELASGKIKVTDIMDAFQKGLPATSAQAEAFQKLGISLTDSNGGMRDAKTVMFEAFTALQGIGNETERDAISMQLFGKSAMELNPLMKMSADEMAKLTEEARKTGAVMSNEQVAALDKTGDSIESLKKSALGLGSSMVTAMLPAIDETVDGLKNLASGIQDAVKTGNWAKVGTMITEMLVSGIKKIAGALPQIVNTVTGLLNEVVKMVVAVLPQVLPVLMDAAMTLLQGLMDAVLANIEPLAAMVTTLMTKLAEFLLASLPVIIEIGLQVLLALAEGIAKAIPSLVPQIVQVVMTIVDAIIQNLPAFIEAAVQIILALTMGLIDALPRLIEWLPTIITSIVTALVDNLPLLIDAAIQIIVALAQALVQNIDKLVVMVPQIIMAIVGGLIQGAGKLVEAVPQLFKALADGFKGADWSEIGKNIIEGIKNGITGAVNGLVNAAKNAGNAALGGMKKILGISSPSKVFRDQIGVNMGLGVAEGIKATTSRVTKAMSTVTDKLKTDIQVNGKVNITGSAQQAVTAPGSGQAVLSIENFYNNTDKDLETLAYQFEFMRKKAAAALGG